MGSVRKDRAFTCHPNPLSESGFVTGREGDNNNIKNLYSLVSFIRYSPEELHAMVDLKPDKKEDD
jgi:hypothetical protein